MFWTLNASQIRPLTALMSLLSCLAISLPSFCPLMLSEKPANVPAEQSTPKMVQLLNEIVRDHLIPPKSPEQYAPDVQALGKEILNFIDALCWRTPDEHAEKFVSLRRDRIKLTAGCRLSCIAFEHELLSIMLDDSQPVWMLARTARILAVLATRALFMAFAVKDMTITY
jgi:hypothetical protein